MHTTHTSDVLRSYEECRAITRDNAKNFYYGFMTLPAAKKRAIWAVYAYCRLVDDIADSEVAALETKRTALTGVRAELDDVYLGQPTRSIFQALADTVHAFGIPREYLEEVIAGAEMDLSEFRYETFEDLYTYCYRVASVVGLISTRIFGSSDPEALKAAEDLGIAMQLTNILRDVTEDLGRDRIYLPLADLRRFDLDETDLRRRVNDARFRKFMQFQVDRARAYFERSQRLFPYIPRDSRACPMFLHGIYSRLLDHIVDHDYDVFSTRVRASRVEKLRLIIGYLVKGRSESS